METKLETKPLGKNENEFFVLFFNILEALERWPRG